MKREPVCVLGERVWRTYRWGKRNRERSWMMKSRRQPFPGRMDVFCNKGFNAGGKRLWKVFVKLQGRI